MNKVVSFLQKYFAVISVLIGISILLSISFSNFIVTSNNHKAAEMYIGELKYSMEIDGTTTNTLTVPTGETIIDVKVDNLNPVDTYYKLLYLKNTNITVKYYESTKDTDDVVTTYNKPNDSVTSSNSNTIKLLITNNSTSSQNIALTMKGGYITNTVQDITTPSTYSEIALVETPSTNTYFCKTNDTLKQGLQYVNGQYTYAYKQEGKSASSGLGWNNISNNAWGVQLTDKTSTEAVTSNICTYINNRPITSTSYMFCNSQAASIDLNSFDTSNVTNMSGMFYNSQATTLNLSNLNTSSVTNMSGMFQYSQATTLNLSNFDTSNVTNMQYMFFNSQVLSLDLSDFDTANVINMDSMLYGTKATALDLSTFNTKNVMYMSYMFMNSQAKIIKLDNFNTSNVIDMGTYGTHTVRIANTSTPSECSKSGFSQTACGFVLEFADLITTHPMNNSATNTGGWPSTSMRTFVNDSIYNALPSDVRNSIINTIVVSGIGSSDSSGSSTSVKSTDKLYLLAPREVYNNYDGTYDTANSLTRTLDYYITQGVTTTNYSGAIKKGENISFNQWWWLRNANPQLSYSFSMVYDDGSFINNFGASESIGVSPAFRIG